MATNSQIPLEGTGCETQLAHHTLGLWPVTLSADPKVGQMRRVVTRPSREGTWPPKSKVLTTGPLAKIVLYIYLYFKY